MKITRREAGVLLEKCQRRLRDDLYKADHAKIRDFSKSLEEFITAKMNVPEAMVDLVGGL
jgi:hypothetical protein